MGVSQSITYFPADKGVYAGAHMDIDSVGPGEYLTSLVEDSAKNPNWDKISVSGDERSLLASQGYNYERQFAHSTNRIRTIKDAVVRNLKARKEGRRGMRTMEAAINDSAIEQITIVQFVKDIIGKMEVIANIPKAFTAIQSNNLRGKIPEGAWPDISVQVDRLEEPLITHTDFGQTFFRIKRNDVHIYISREDRMEASIDPYSFSTARAQKQVLQARELLALKELSNITLPSANSAIADPTELKSSAAVVPRAVNDTVGDFLKIITDHYTTYRNWLKHVIINTLDFRAIETNFYVRNNIKVEAAQPIQAGVIPFPGLGNQGIMAHVSPWCPRRNIYFLADEGAYEINGPKVVDTEYDARRFADYTPIRDFVGFLISHPARFAEKRTLTLGGMPAIGMGTEIKTDSQIEELLKPPAVMKNDDAN